MSARTARRRRIAIGVLAVLAAGAFAIGAALGDGGSSRAARPPVARTLSLGQLVGERIVTSLRGTEVPFALKRAIAEGRLAGVVLFEESFPSRAAGRRLIDELQSIPRPRALRTPLLVMVDQEGGQVTRLDGAPTLSAREMGERGAAASRRQGVATAKSLRDVGVNVDLAPVLDVGRPGGVIDETGRAFGSSPSAVAAAAVPFAEGLEAGGVAATAKHFPGLGSASENTDFEAQRIDTPKAQLRAVDEAPYRRFIAAGGRLVMLSTAIYPAFGEAPAAFEPAIATGELRQVLGFRGVSVTDSLGSAAVEEFGGPAAAAVAGVRAGDDLLLFADLKSAELGRRALLAKLHGGALDRGRFEESVTRVLRLRAALARRG